MIVLFFIILEVDGFAQLVNEELGKQGSTSPDELVPPS